VREIDAKLDPIPAASVDRETDRSDAILVARLKHTLETPGISDTIPHVKLDIPDGEPGETPMLSMQEKQVAADQAGGRR